MGKKKGSKKGSKKKGSKGKTPDATSVRPSPRTPPHGRVLSTTSLPLFALLAGNPRQHIYA